jgi:hypothetical protein
MAAHCYRHEDLLRLGDRDGAGRALDEADELARHYRHPYWQWAVQTWRGLRASIDGDLETAERLAHEACERQVGVAEATACLGVNLVNLRLFQDRAGEVLDLLGAAADASPQIPCYRAVLALCAAEAGHEELARTSYRSFAAADFANLPEDTNRFLGLGVLAHVAVELGDRVGGRRLAELLGPYRGQWVLLNCYGGGGAHWGPVAHQLARLAVLDDRDEDADALFSEAVEASTGAPLVEARIVADRARVPVLR